MISRGKKLVALATQQPSSDNLQVKSQSFIQHFENVNPNLKNKHEMDENF